MNDITRYVDFYGKDFFNLRTHYRLKKISEYMTEFETEPKTQYGSPFAYECLNDQNAYVSLIREHERNDMIVGEGEIMTYPACKALNRLKKYCSENLESELVRLKMSDTEIVKTHYRRILDMSDENYAGENEPVDLLRFVFPFYAYTDDTLKKFVGGLADSLYVCGYNYSSISTYRVAVQPFEKPIILVSVVFEAKFREKTFEWSEWLYHVTSFDKLSKIRKNGLIPSSGSNRFEYPERVYLFNNANKNIILDYLKTKTNAVTTEKLVILRINGARLRATELFKAGKLKFYIDPMFENGMTDANAVFTYGVVNKNLIDDQILIVSLENGTVTDMQTSSFR